MKKPFVVCHMLTSLDGKIDGAFFDAPETTPASKAYGTLREHYSPQATIYGTTTMISSYADGTSPTLSLSDDTSPEKADFVNPQGKAMGNYIISLDPKGILKFSSHIIEKKGRPAAHVIEVLTEQVSTAYLSYLQKQGISYLFAGEKCLDCKLLLRKLAEQFEIKRLMIAGGGITNWSFLQDGLIDELSLVIAPVADGNTSAVSIFEQADFLPQHKPIAFRLIEAKPLDGSALWLRYGII